MEQASLFDDPPPVVKRQPVRNDVESHTVYYIDLIDGDWTRPVKSSFDEQEANEHIDTLRNENPGNTYHLRPVVVPHTRRYER